MKKQISKLLLLVPLWSALAFADHSSPMGSVGLLLAYAQDLEQAVQYSSLQYNIKSVVFEFVHQVNHLADCIRREPRPIFNGHIDDIGVVGSCRSEFYGVQSSFRSVERYLYDTNWDYPDIYNAYVSTRRALNAISVSGGPGPGPGPSLYRCTAVDAGWEEHFSGHMGYGRTSYDAQRSALNECQRAHRRCRIQSCNLSR